MEMIRKQTISKDIDDSGQILPATIQEEQIIVVIEKHTITAISTVVDVIKHSFFQRYLLSFHILTIQIIDSTFRIRLSGRKVRQFSSFNSSLIVK
ncbi:hypothetical protein SDC9_56562 [bioreactor metagenome]|uniref:Uncharacterized protein n=1 Tax=bioreactor metagenome TaxID=1076179 RepID=A0A644X7V9_9ZZZZ